MKEANEARGVLPLISYVGMYRPKGYGLWAVLVWKWAWILQTSSENGKGVYRKIIGKLHHSSGKIGLGFGELGDAPNQKFWGYSPAI